MFKRFYVHFALILLFALAQMGAITHEISHVTDSVKHSQQDPLKQKTTSEQCEQCISFAKVAGGLPAQSFVLPNVQTHFIDSTQLSTQALSQPHSAYAARAPPLLS